MNYTREENMIVNFQNKIDLKKIMRYISSLGDFEWFPVILYMLFLQNMLNKKDFIVIIIGQIVLIFLKIIFTLCLIFELIIFSKGLIHY